MGWVLSSFQRDEDISRESSKVDFFVPLEDEVRDKFCLSVIILTLQAVKARAGCEWSSKGEQAQPHLSPPSWGIRVAVWSFLVLWDSFEHLIAVPEGEPVK